MLTIDQLYLKMRGYAESRDIENASQCLAQIKKRIHCEITKSRRWYFIQNFEGVLNGNKDSFILDYGCGGGQTVIYLYLLGFKNVYGIDLKSQDLNNLILGLSGSKNIRCFQYDGTTLPFNDNKFDIIFSEQVLEHVHNIDKYYEEASRVLKPKSIAFFSFPHKFIPYDAHGRLWFIHMFPKSVSLFFYRILGRDVDHFRKLLNFQTISHHRELASKYFVDIKNISSERLKHFSDDDLKNYRGNKKLRKAMGTLIKLKVLGPVVLTLLSNFAIADLIMKKPNSDIHCS